MKYTAFLKIIFLFICFSSYSQTVTVAIIDKVLAPKDTAVLDIDGDSNIDIKILRFTGIDNIMYSATSKQVNIKLGDLAKQSGQTFSNYGNQCSLPSSVFGCYWIPAWQLNTGQRYMGYYRLNAPGDTTFGYINLAFVGDNQSGCFDTLYIYSNTYSTVSNVHLLAGQPTSTTCPTPITYSIQVTPPTCSVCCDGSAQIVNLSGGCSPPYTAIWQNGSQGLIQNNMCSGNYSVTVMDSQGGSCCPNVTQGCFVPFGGATSIDENSLDNNLSIYPNLTNSVLNIVDKQNEFQNGIIEIKNYLGQFILRTSFVSQIDLSELSTGMYFLTISNSIYSKSAKVIKQ